MPLAAPGHLDTLYSRLRLLNAEVERLETERDGVQDVDRLYILDVILSALQEEASALDASVADILERDLQR